MSILKLFKVACPPMPQFQKEFKPEKPDTSNDSIFNMKKKITIDYKKSPLFIGEVNVLE